MAFNKGTRVYSRDPALEPRTENIPVGRLFDLTVPSPLMCKIFIGALKVGVATCSSALVDVQEKFFIDLANWE